jgi:DNA-binding CsgD family transcriptional regulator/tetratricopeptide (TPR) repeat protein
VTATATVTESSVVRATIDDVSRWDVTPLVGRTEELERLLADLERARSGRSTAVLLSGDAGVGKTRLLDELSARAVDRGFRVLTGHCVDLGDVGLPYLPFVDLLRPAATDPALAPESASDPALMGLLSGRPGAQQLVPLGGEGRDLGRPPPNRAAPQPADDGRLQLFESVAGLICELAAGGPLLLVLEDLHWADRSSRDLLRYLLARLVDEPVAVVASYRSDDLHRRHPLRPLLAELVRLPVVERLDLAPLPDPDVSTLVRRLADDVPDRIVHDVVARAEGNAFFAEELLAAGRQGETLPMGLTDVLLARVEQRSPAVQQVLRIAAAAGRRVRHEWVAAVGGLAPAELDSALVEAVHHHLLVVSDDGRYRFRHALLREAVIADLLPGERVRLHGAIASYLRNSPGAGTAAELAHHSRESNDLPGAFEASLEAAVHACRVGAPAEQLQHLEAALALWSAVPDADERAGRDQAALLLEAAIAARTAGELHRAIALLRSALTLLGDDGDPVTRARLHYTLAQTMVRVEDHTAAHRESATAMALVPASPPSEVRTWAAATHARMSYAIALMDEGDTAAEEALSAADALGLDSAWADTAVSQVRSRQTSDIAAVEARLDEALQRARRSGDVEVEMRVLYNRALIPFEAGQIAESLEWTRRATQRARDLGMEWAFYPTELRHLQVNALYMLGDWDASLAEADLLARVPEMAAHVRAGGLLVQVGRGDPTVTERLAWAKSLLPRLNAHYLLTMVTAAAEIDLASWAGDPDTAVDLALTTSARLKAVWEDDHLAVLRLLAIAVGALGDTAAAARVVNDTAEVERRIAQGEPLLDFARGAVAAFARTVGEMGVEGRAWMARVEAEGTRLRGEPAVERWRAAVDAFAFGHVYEEARSRWRLAEALLLADDRVGAATEAQAAHAVAVRLGAAPLRTAIENLARRGRLEVDGVRRAAGVDTVFTPREAEVLALMAQGRTNRQIGAELYISEKTASVHVSNILGKLAANGRTEAVAIAASRGLLPTS